MSHVRYRADAESTELNDQLGANAFTLGNSVFFRDHLPDVSRPDGAELVAHELAHTFQRSPAGDDSIGRIRRRPGKNGGKRGGKKSGKKGGKKNAKKSARGGRKQDRGGNSAPVQAPPVTVPTADSAFTELAGYIDLAVPANGDTGKVEAKVKIPLDPAGSSFLEFDLEGEVERSDEGVKAGFDVAVGYGLSSSGVLPFGITGEALGKLGGFVQATGSSSSQVLKLISYGFFRQFRESNLVAREFTNYLWGQGGETGETSGVEADKWGATLEEEVFGANDGASVSVGAYGALVSGLKLEGVAEGEIASKLSTATKYDKSTLEASSLTGDSQLGSATKDKAAGGISGLAGYYMGRGAEKSVGEVERKLSSQVKLAAGPLGGEAAIELALGDQLDFELKASLAGTMGASQRRPVQIVETLITALAPVANLVNFLRTNERSMAQYIGQLAGTADVIGGYVASFETARNELLAELNGKIGGKGARQVEAVWSLTCEADKIKQPTLKVSYVTEYGVGGDDDSAPPDESASIGPALPSAEAKVSRKRQLVVLSWPKL